MEWKNPSPNVWTLDGQSHRVVLYSYATHAGESFYWDIFDSHAAVGSGVSATLGDAKRLAEQELKSY